MRYLKITICLTLAWAAAPASADVRVRPGALGGVQYTDVTWTPAPDFDVTGRTRAHFGGLVELDFGKPVSIEPRVMWLQTGLEAGFSLEQGFTGARLSIDYVALPVLVRYRLAPSTSSVVPFVIAGPEWLFEARTKAATESNGALVETDDFEEDVAGTSVSVDVGGGVEFVRPAFRVFVEGMYSHGLTNIDAGDDADVKYRALRFSVGVRF